MLDISSHFVRQGTRAVPVEDPLKQRAVLLREGFSSEETRGVYQAWNFIDGTLQSEADIKYATHVKKLLFWLRLAAYFRSDFSRNA